MRIKNLFAAAVLVCIAMLSGCAQNKTAAPEGDEVFKFTAADFTQVDGSTVTIPLSEGLAQSTGVGEEYAAVIRHNTTPVAIKNVIDGTRAIAFVTYPSEAEIQSAAEKGVELEIVPVVNDAFVFLVNKDHPVNGLTSEQIRQIYSGKITNWKEVGGADTPIRALQREYGSGSQSGMIRFMGDEKLASPPKDYEVMGMGTLVEHMTTAFDADKSAIGYSYYYYVNAMYVRDTVKLLAVDGVAPDNRSIAQGSYPVITPYYAVLRKDSAEDSFARRLLRYTLSEAGQAVAESAGYVRVN